MEMDAGRLVKQAFLASAALAQALARRNSITKPCAGQWSPTLLHSIYHMTSMHHRR